MEFKDLVYVVDFAVTETVTGGDVDVIVPNESQAKDDGSEYSERTSSEDESGSDKDFTPEENLVEKDAREIREEAAALKEESLILNWHSRDRDTSL